MCDMKKPCESTADRALLEQKMSTAKGRWELLHPGACYECSGPGVTTYHDYDKGCPLPKD